MKIFKSGSGLITVIDGLFTDDELEKTDKYFGSYTYWGLGYDMESYGAASATLCRSLKWEQWIGLHGMVGDINETMRRRLHRDSDIKVPYFERCLINNFKFGDSPMFHKDNPSSDTAMTFMVYPNKVWNLNWGGFTAFADDDDNVIDCINPKPGRITVFPGNLNHSGVAPTKVHQGYGRFSMAYQDTGGNYDKPEERARVKPEDIEKASMQSIFGDDYARL
jgi:hypothetical protein|tara:strand:+ start:277 stop:939 length:663 start_codon:yes stop_codon:yes gene_type:complete